MVQLTVKEPVRGETWGPEVLQMSGLDMLRAGLERRLPEPPITRLTGLRLSEVGLGMATDWMPASPWWQSGAGIFFAGSTAFVADLALGCAVLTSAPPGVAITSSELSVSFLRPGTTRSQTLIGRARLIQSTRSLGLAEATIEDGRGRLLGHATSRCVLFRPDPEILAARRLENVSSSDSPDPHLREVEGEIYGQDWWNQMAGLDVMRQVVEGSFLPPGLRLLGIRGLDVSEGRMTVAMPASGWLSNAFGVTYGGAIAYLADAAMLMSAATTVPAGTAFNSIDLKVYFLRPLAPQDGELVARATVVHRGRTIAVASCDILGPSGTLVAQATGSTLILPGRPWERPVQVADDLSADSGRVLTTVLFIDIVDSSGRVAQLGDRRWGELLADYQGIVRHEARRFRGREVNTAGDGFLIAFDGAARAVQCALAIHKAVQQVGLELRSGLHAGECEESGGSLVGIALHVGARIGALAERNEILVSSMVKDLVSGSGIEFDDRGEHPLKGIAGEWRLYAARA